jgi:hypothetical protein
MKPILSFFGFQAGLFLLALILCVLVGCKKIVGKDPVFFAQLSNAHIKGCRATEKSIDSINSSNRLQVWNVRCRNDQDYVCSLARGQDLDRVTCSLQSIPVIREAELRRD